MYEAGLPQILDQKMKIQINGKEQDIEPTSTIDDLFRQMKIERNKGLAMALNNEVVPKDKWKETSLSENDKVLIIRATSGG